MAADDEYYYDYGDYGSYDDYPAAERVTGEGVCSPCPSAMKGYLIFTIGILRFFFVPLSVD